MDQHSLSNIHHGEWWKSNDFNRPLYDQIEPQFLENIRKILCSALFKISAKPQLAHIIHKLIPFVIFLFIYLFFFALFTVRTLKIDFERFAAAGVFDACVDAQMLSTWSKL